MKIKFESNLEFQKEAIESITGIFEGQEICKANFTVLAPVKEYETNTDQYLIKETQEVQGFTNKLSLLDDEILENVQRIQLKNGLKQSQLEDVKDNYNFTVEMETGTGKTYVYLRTIFELNKLYGFTKFIIVVPSIAIKEGTNKSLEITKDHFKGLYDNTNYDFFTYDSQSLEQVRSFATNDYIQIMVINIDAFRRSFTDLDKEDKANIIHRESDKLGHAPIELIKETNPIVIIDEPQSVDNTEKSKEAIASLNPLCCLRYSATHKEKYNMMYKLDSVDAYEKKLVKQIEVSSLAVQDSHNAAYIKLLKVDNKKSVITAQVEIDIAEKNGVKRIKKIVKKNTDLAELTKRSIYSGYIINDIYCEKGNEYIDFTSKEDVLYLGASIGGIDDLQIKQKQIATTIEKHLDKELILNPQGIKVLSLFFIDKVSNYRFYDEDNNPQQGRYAKIFEEEYKRLSKKPKYNTLFKEIKDLDEEVDAVHNGYFAIDKKGHLKDSKGNTQADDNTYSLIMKDKEKLLSFDSKLRFIFSHSALKEGWDNPNVFQICTLNETSSEMKKRQEIGRGLRLCVNQEGNRVHGFEVNTLTVMANESYTDFVTKLQKEIEEDTGIRFGLLNSHSFANIILGLDGDNPQYLGEDKSKELWKYYKDYGYINNKGMVQDKLKKDLKENNLNIPEKFLAVKGQIDKQLRRVAGSLNIKNADNKQKVKVNKKVLLSPEFEEIWNKIKYKTTYQVNFDSEKLIEECAKAIRSQIVVGKGKFIVSTAKVEIERGGLSVGETTDKTLIIEDYAHNLPDIISYLQNETNLTRKTIYQILIKSNRLEAFKINPQRFIDQTIKIIKSQMKHLIVDGIKYKKIGDDCYYAQTLFEEQELFGHLKQDMIESKKSPYDYVVYDSNVESEICQDFENSDNVKLYAKLPSWFKIDTPLGSYNPDWAVLWEQDSNEKLYFVVETKSTLDLFERRGNENDKISCGKKHFEALNNEVDFVEVENFERLRDKVSQ
ncbi:DEAD/DEAH box helicase family protein [bacterium]|nr:DEAD/DEAH box helicase family protein [bacterium]